MVKLNKIYTKTGDKGETGLVGTARVPKSDLRIHCIGEVDEANAAIGLARLHTEGDEDAMLQRIQHDLFDLGADLATPYPPHPPRKQGGIKGGEALRIVEAQVKRLESEIDAMNERLSPLTSFVLPGGSQGAAYLHLARTIVRRAERSTFTMAGKTKINPHALQYLNRLSDHLFVLARVLNDDGTSDVLWQPGVNR